MARRLELQVILETILGSRNVYFQPPENLKMQYPCIVYARDNLNIDHADNNVYHLKTRYQITVIDVNPDSIIHEKIAALPLSSYSRFFTADNLNHDVYSLYF